LFCSESFVIGRAEIRAVCDEKIDHSFIYAEYSHVQRCRLAPLAVKGMAITLAL
jgi:hypothetical protein